MLNRLCYKEWTPPWHRRKIAFIVGKAPSLYAMLLNGILPTSRDAQNVSDRPLCCAVLCEWLKREKNTLKLLLRCLHVHTFRVSENYILKKCSSPGVVLGRSDSQSPCAHLGVAFRTSQSPGSIHLAQKLSVALKLAFKNQIYPAIIQCQNQAISRTLTKRRSTC